MRSLRKILLWTLLILCLPLLLAIGGAAAFVWLAGEDTWTAALRQATDAASTTDQQITVSGFRRGSDGVVRLATLGIADDQGPWLAVHDIELDWMPSALLDGTVKLQTVSARQVELLRQPPADKAPSEPEPFSFPDRIEIPELPVAIEIERLSINEIILAEGIAPERTRLSLNGKLLAQPENLSIDLKVLPLDLGDSRLTADISLTPETGALTAEVDADLPVIEPLKGALAAPDNSRLNLSIKGAGPLTNTRLDFGVSVEGVLDLIGDLKLAIDTNKGLQAELTAFASMIGGVSAEPAGIIGPAVELRIVAELPSPDRLVLSSASIDAQYLRAEANGTVNLADNALQIDLESTFRHHAGLASITQGARFETVSVKGTVSGPFDDLTTKVAMDLDQPGFEAYNSAAVGLVVDARVAGQSATGKLALTARDPVVSDPQIAPILGNEVHLNTAFAANPSVVQLTDLSIATAFAQLSGDLAVDPETSAATGDLSLTADKLPVAPQLSELMSDGNARVTINLQNAGPASGEVKLHANVDNLAWRDPMLQSLAGNSLTLIGSAALASAGQSAELVLKASEGLEARIDATLGNEQIAGDYRVSLPNVPAGLVPPQIAGLGNIVLAGKVFGPLDNPGANARLTTSDLSVNGVLVHGPVINLAATELTQTPEADLRISTRILDDPLNLRTGFTVDPATGLLRIGALDLSWKSLAVTARGEADINTLRSAIDATVHADLSEFSDLAGTPLAGKVEADLTSSQNGNRTDAVINARVNGLEGSGILMEELLLDLNLQDALATVPGLSGSIQVNGIATGDAAVERVTIGLSGNVQRPAADIRIASTAPVDAILTTRLQTDLTRPEAITATFETLTLAAAQADVSAASPFVVTARGEAVGVAGLDLTSSIGGRVSGSAAYAPDRIATNLTVDNLQIGPLAALAGLEGFGGQANAKVRMDTAHASDRARIDLAVTGLTVPDVPADTPFTIKAGARWDGVAATAETTVSGPFDSPLVANLRADLPAAPGQGLPDPSPNSRVSGAITWKGDVARFLALLPESDHLASGAAVIDVELTGTLSEPAMKGNVTIADGRYENQLTGTQLSSLGLDVAFNDSGAGRFNLSASGPEGGTVIGGGDVILVGPSKGAEINIAIRNLLALRRDEVRAIIGGDTRLTWDGKRVNVHVRKELERVNVFLATPDLPPSVVAIELERERDRGAETEAKGGSDLPVDLDIQVSSPGQFFVRGRGLESEWRGDLVVTGTASEPVIRSRFEAVRGSLALLGRDFTLDKGELGLDESFKPTFRVELLRETPELTGRIVVSGNPASPDIAFTSEPELPPDEVLPRIMFDKAKQSLSPLEAISLAQSIRTLTNGKPGATDRIRSAVGLDVLRFEEGDTAGSAGAVTVGRYVREGVYVGAKKSVDSDAGSVVVEIDVLPNVKVDAEVDQGGGSSTGITWEKKY